MGRRHTPAVGCDVFVVDERSRVLLVRQAADGLWSLPGGAQDFGETPSQCAARECREETGYRVRVVELIGAFSSLAIDGFPNGESEYVGLLFYAEVIGGGPEASGEIAAVGWFDVDECPSLVAGHRARINTGFRYLQEGESFTAHFD